MMPSANQDAPIWSPTAQRAWRYTDSLPSLFRGRPGSSLLLAFVLTLLIACNAGGDETLEQSFQVGDWPRLVVGVGNGSVLVKTGPTGTISVSSAVRNKDDVDLDVSADGDIVTVRSDTTISGSLIGDRAEGAVDFTVTVPPRTVVEVGAAAGPVTLTGVQGGGTITASAGAIELRGVSGDYSGGAGVGDIRITDSSGSFRFTVGNGSIKFDGVLVAGGLNEFETGVGDVIVSFPEGAGVDLDATVSTGTISSELTLKNESSDPTSTGGGLSGTVGDGGAELLISVGSGSVELRDKTDEPSTRPVGSSTP